MFVVGKAGFSEKCFKTVTSLHESLEDEIKKIAVEQVVDGIDEFYSDFKNRSIDLKWAFLVVMQQIEGKPEKEIKEFLDYIRQNPDQ